ncbi:hypothetical protein PIB30_037094, partial [Stylosanthes scabra]|nr:hypothetical protein [Stylosanthes scabra]
MNFGDGANHSSEEEPQNSTSNNHVHPTLECLFTLNSTNPSHRPTLLTAADHHRPTALTSNASSCRVVFAGSSRRLRLLVASPSPLFVSVFKLRGVGCSPSFLSLALCSLK